MPTFVLSTGRTGTVFVSNILDQLPGVSAKHERGARFLRILENVRFHNPDYVFTDRAVNYISQSVLKNNKETHFEIPPP